MVMKIEIEDRDYLVERVAEQVLQQLYDRGENVLGEAIKKAVQKLVADHASEMVVEALAPKIQEAIEGDFGTEDSYGNRKPKTIRALIVDHFASDRHGSRTRIQEIVEAQVQAIMKAEFQPMIEGARKALRERLDHILGEKVSLAVREAVGLR